MAPSRVIGKDIRRALNAADIEALSYFAEEQLEEEEAQRAFTILTLLAKRNDRIALRCWLGGWTNGYRSGSYRKLRDYCESKHKEPWNLLEQIADGAIRLPGVSHLIGPFNDLRHKLQLLEGVKGQDLLDALFPSTAEWAEDIRVLAGEYIHEDVEARGLYDLLVDAITQPTMPIQVSHVRVMSLHKSKGLTARASVIAGAVEGLVPRPYDGDKSFLTEAEHLEEQRRLFYVAMTRSKEFLLLSSPAYVDLKFAYSYQLPGNAVGSQFRTTVSQFITSLGPSVLPAASRSLTFP
jgi:DNA helicase II / ATP-dependent DNA helicase PcrA